jgi:hypothetical protein
VFVVDVGADFPQEFECDVRGFLAGRIQRELIGQRWTGLARHASVVRRYAKPVLLAPPSLRAERVLLGVIGIGRLGSIPIARSRILVSL